MITNDPSTAVVHLNIRFGDLSISEGTGVLYARNGKLYLVTAWHNVTGRHPETLNLLSDKTAAIPDNVVATVAIRLYDKTHTGYVRRSLALPLHDSNGPLYLVYPDPWPRRDVVALPLDPEGVYEELYITMANVHSKRSRLREVATLGASSDFDSIDEFENYAPPVSPVPVSFPVLSITDELFIPGYPEGVADSYANPIWKRANVASNPNYPAAQHPSFFIDCASRAGMSGAPVLYHNKNGINNGGVRFVAKHPVTVFHGIYTGRQGVVSEFEAQIGKVWKREVVDEICDSGISSEPSETIFIGAQAIRTHLLAHWPKDNYAGIVTAKPDLAWTFVHHVMSALNARANPQDVYDLIIEVAKEKAGTP